MGQPQSLASSHKAAVSLAHLGVFNGIWSESRWHRPHIQSFCLEIKLKPQKVLGQSEKGCGEAERPAVSLLWL